jgi:hypothetical protein
MVDYPMVTRADYAATLQAGIERNSPDFENAMEGNFASLLNRAQPATPAPAQPAPAFFEPPPSPAPARSPEPPASIYSAPVSRRDAGSASSPRSTIHLSPQEQEYARVAGVSDVEYAKQKAKLIQRKANGDYGERR